MPRLRVLHLSTSDVGGGAAIAARRIVEAQRRAGIDADWLLFKSELPQTSHLYPPRTIALAPWQKRFLRLGQLLEWLIIFLGNGRRKDLMFKTTFAWSGLRRLSKINTEGYDLIHLHWVQGGFVSLSLLEKIHYATGLPIVYTLHDVWCSTAVCHLNGTCQGSASGCKECPIVSPLLRPMVRRAFGQKQRMYAQTPTLWIALSTSQKADLQRSKIVPSMGIHRIPNPIDTQFWTPALVSPKKGKEDPFVILFVAERPDDPNKGLEYLIEMFGHLRPLLTPSMRTPLLCVVGEARNPKAFDACKVDVDCRGAIRSQDELRKLYQEADLLICASRYETFGQTIVEALATGTPVLSTRCGGPQDAIIEGVNGQTFLSDAPQEMAQTLGAILAGEIVYSPKACRESAMPFSLEKVGEAYRQLYPTLIAQ